MTPPTMPPTGTEDLVFVELAGDVAGTVTYIDN
jgi:hypothetical protein